MEKNDLKCNFFRVTHYTERFKLTNKELQYKAVDTEIFTLFRTSKNCFSLLVGFFGKTGLMGLIINSTFLFIISVDPLCELSLFFIFVG